MVSILLLGLFIGMQHALEADHIAAVASIAVRQSSVSRIVRHGAVWGVGHTITLMMFAGAALFLDQAIEEALSTILELCVGLLLVGLGSHLFYRLWRDRVHFHTHRHANGVQHLHAHSHRDEREDHASSEHNHAHPGGVPLKTLLVGMMQGLAGSAVLLVLTTATVNDPVTGMMYIAMFGFGSVLGMAALSVFIAIPLSYSAFALTWVNRGLQVVVGGTTVILGLAIILRSAPI
ncbi:MAG: urease accessory protein [Magnetovibrio sp.]|nr:urease accessory protein [Magnetovibrio sp.]